MELAWDEKKRLANIRKHGFDFADCAQVFMGPLVTSLDVQFEYGEPRFIAAGLIRNRVVVVAYAEAHGAIRVVSMRKACKHEETYYFENLSRLQN
ncbi:MAG: BrnT family toxin [Gammaproteobacteria bacterium]